MIVAANHENLALIQLMLEMQADCFLVDQNGWTVLHAACFASRDDIIELLFAESHIDVAAKNDDG